MSKYRSAPSAYAIEQAMSVLLSLGARLRDANDETDADALLAVLDGDAPDCMDVLRGVIRASIEADSLADAADARIKALSDRRNRFKHRRDTLRGAAFAALDALGLDRLDDPEFTASRRLGQPRPVVVDDAALPPDYWRVSREHDLAAIRDDLKAGVVIPGVEISNGNPSLTVRTR